jgi:PAS domain-containing protein
MSDHHHSRQSLGVEVVALRKQVIDLKEAALIRRRIEDALRESEALLRRGFEEAPVPLGVIGSRGRLLLANPALVRRLGYRSAQELRAIADLGDLFLDFDSVAVLGTDPRVRGERQVNLRWRRGDGTIEVIACRVGRGAEPGGTVWLAPEQGPAGAPPRDGPDPRQGS